MPKLAHRLELIKPSATVAVAQKAQKLKAEGEDVLSFSLGQPDFDTPKHICEAAKRAIDAGATRYTATRGIIELREAICADSKKRRGVDYSPEEVVVSVGAKHTLFNLALALFEKGDEVLIPAPYWVSYPEQVRLAGATPLIIPTEREGNFLLSTKSLQSAITERTKALILCTPSNPTGSAYTEADLQKIAEVAARHDLWLIVDEIYSQLVYGDFKQTSLATLAPELRSRTIIVDGVSKSYAMTGWRIGWMLAPAHVAKACDKIQSQSTTNPTAVAQFAAMEALNGDQTCVKEMRNAFAERREIIVHGLNRIEGIECDMPRGAFYAFADIRALMGKRTSGGKVLDDDIVFSEWLLDEAQIAVVPGTAFGAQGFIRISYAASPEQIQQGLARMEKAVATLL